MARPNARWLLSKLPIAVILASGAFLRFHALGARALWWDEILVPLAAQHNIKYIFDLCSASETHPPLFYLITRLMLYFYSSDAALRIFSACCGVITIYLVYHVIRKFIDERTALLASALQSVNILHLLVSRELRPYSLQILLFVLSCLFIARLVKYGRWRDLILLCCSHFFLFWLHYFSYYLIAAQGIILAISMFTQSSRFTYKQFILFCIITVLTAGPLLVWFVLPSLAQELAGAALPRLTVFYFIKMGLWTTSFFISFKSFLGNLMYIVPLAGCIVFLVHKPRQAVFCLLLGLMPFAIILLMAPGYPMQFWHAAWVTPLTSLFSAVALSWLPWRKAAAPFLAVAGAVLILIYQCPMYYEPLSANNSVDFRAAAARLEPLLQPGTLVSDVSYPGFFNAVSWYFDRLPSNPFATQSLEPNVDLITLHFVFGALLDNQQQPPGLSKNIQMAMGDQGQVTQDRNATVYTFHMNRQTTTAIDGLPATFVFSADAKGFYSRVHRLRNVRSVAEYTLAPKWATPERLRTLEGGVVATRNNQSAFFEFVLIKNTPGDKPLRLSADLRYANSGAGNRIRLLARFDDEAPVSLAESAGPDPNRSLSVNFSRNTPFKRLAFIVEMYCKDDTALPIGGNLRTLLFQGLFVDIAESGQTAPSP